jgi:N-acetylmuramoyl-L-alanine amidase
MYLKEPPLRGDDVRELQATLNNVGFNAGRVSGVFGNQTDKAVREFQRNVGLEADGIIGETTVQALDNFRMRVSSGGITGVWDRSALLQPDPLTERRIVIDNDGHDLSARIAAALCDNVRAAGAKPLAVPATITQGDPKERAWFANEAEADLLVRIEQGEADEYLKHGSVCEYFDNGEFFSARSKAIAGLLQDEIVSAMRVFDNGIEGKNLTILQATKMPAIVVRPAVLSDSKDAETMSAAAAAERVAAAMADALKRYWEK